MTNAENTPLVESECSVCKQTDDHPKFLVVGPADGGLGWDTMHHDCAASQGHLHASFVVQHTNGAKGDELRYALTDPDHPVHAAIQQDIDYHEAASKEAGSK